MSKKPSLSAFVKAAMLGRVDLLDDARKAGKRLGGCHAGMPLTHHAASVGQLAVLEWLVAEGVCSVKDTDERGGTAMLEAAAAGQIGVIQWLVKRGLRADETDQRGDHVLSVAAGYGQLEVRGSYIVVMSLHHVLRRDRQIYIYRYRARGRVPERASVSSQSVPLFISRPPLLLLFC